MRLWIVPRLALATVVVSALIAVSSASADPLGSRVRISQTGADADTTAVSADPAAAYNPQTRRYLLVWTAGVSPSPGNPFSAGVVVGRFVDLAGNPVGPTFDISAPDPCPSGDTCLSGDPTVAYNPQANEFLIVWHFFDITNPGPNFIRGQRVSATGGLLGTHDVLISRSTTNGVDPQVRYASASNTYLVVWANEGLVPAHAFGQRVGADGNPLSTTDTQLSQDIGAVNGTQAGEVSVAYDSVRDRWLIAYADDASAGHPDRIVTRVINANLTPFADAMVMSNGLPSSSGTLGITNPSAIFNATGQEFLVAYQREVPGGAGNTPDQVVEVQRLDPSGNRIPPDAVQLSDINVNSIAPTPAWDARANQYAVIWEGGELPGTPPTGLDSNQVFGQMLNASAGVIGTNQFNISQHLGDSEGRALVYNPDTCEFLAAWEGALDNGKFEIFARRLSAPACPTPAPAAAPTPTSAPQLAPGATINRATFCKSRRRFQVRPRVPRDTSLLRVTVTLQGRRLPLKGRRKAATINVAGLPPGTVTVTIKSVFRNGRKVTERRRYRTCATRRHSVLPGLKSRHR